MEKVGLYEKAEVTISLLDPKAEEQTFESVRNTALQSGLVPVELGLRFPISEFTMVDVLSPGEATVFDT